MKKILRILAIVLAASLAVVAATSGRRSDQLRLVYWNIQNGMWDGQPDNYDRFVDWVKAQKPDICVWCEAATIYKDGTADKMKGDKYLPKHWDELARRYGHKYVFRGGWRDNYPQVVTSRYPIEGVLRITGVADTLFTEDGIRVTGSADTLVAHGAGWVRLHRGGKTLNIVTLHTWPHSYGFNVPSADRQRSSAAREGDKYRRTEMEYICKHTIGTVPGAENQYWMMMGDFNSISRVDNYVHQFPDDDTRLLVHDYIHANTPYHDIIFEREPWNHYSSTGGKHRIDYVYCTQPLFDCVTAAHIHTDEYTKPVRDAQKISNFWHPSDHRPIIVDFDLSR